jgi:glycosyltransferase involved in cell wall biosynthesis
MRIVFIARNIPIPGAPENDIVLQFAHQLRVRGADVHLLYPAEWIPLPKKFLRGKALAIANLDEKFAALGFEVKVVRYIRLPTARLSYLLSGWFWPRPSFGEVDFIHAHHVMPDGEMAHVMGRDAGVPFVVTARRGDLKKMDELPVSSKMHRMFRSVLRKAALVLSPSNPVVARLLGSNPNVRALPHGIDDLGAGVGVTNVGDELTVAVVATLFSQKRVDWVVRAIGEYKGRRRVRLVHAGDGPERPAVESLAAASGVQMQFLGKVPRERVFALMRESAIFTLPSRSETFGLVYIEAAISGCAVLGCAGTGVDGYYEHAREMCFSPDNYHEFRSWLWKLLDDEEFRRNIAQGGLSRTRRDYLWDAVVERYQSLTASVTSR